MFISRRPACFRPDAGDVLDQVVTKDGTGADCTRCAAPQRSPDSSIQHKKAAGRAHSLKKPVRLVLRTAGRNTDGNPCSGFHLHRTHVQHSLKLTRTRLPVYMGARVESRFIRTWVYSRLGATENPGHGQNGWNTDFHRLSCFYPCKSVPFPCSSVPHSCCFPHCPQFEMHPRFRGT